MSLSTKNLQTRISLKYDTWENWSKWYSKAAPDTALSAAPDYKADNFDFTPYANKGAALVLNKGEVAFVKITAAEEGSTLEPVMFKVGDGITPFCKLDWASAKAADVYGWAKESQSEFETRVSGLISAALNGEGTATIKGYVTESDFNEFKTELENTTLKGITDRLGEIEKDYTTASEAEAAAKAAADIVLGTDADEATANTVYGAKAAAKAAQDKADDNASAIDAINTAISELDDTYASEEELENVRADLQGKIDTKVAQSDYNTKVQELANADSALDGRVGTLETNVGELQTQSALHATKEELNTAVAGLKAGTDDTADSETIAGAKKYADKKVDDLLKAYILDEENGGTTDAVDKLQEIAAWITDDAAGAAKIIADVAALDTNKLDKKTFNEFESGDFAKVVADAAHTNRAELDKIVVGDKDKWDTAVTALDTHTKDTVAHITAAERTKWDDVVNKASQTDLNTHITNEENPHKVTAAQVGAYTTEEADANFAALSAFESDKTTVKEATHAANADNATNAVNAEKATADANGKVIADTYETISNVDVERGRIKALEDLNELIIDCGTADTVIF